MKIRSGFVSNSSTSSFIVAIKNSSKTITKAKIEIEIDLADYGSDVINNVKELNSYYEKEYDFNPDEPGDKWTGEQYNLAKKAIEEGKTVIFGSFESDSDQPIESLLCAQGLKGCIKDKNIDIIHSEPRY